MTADLGGAKSDGLHPTDRAPSRIGLLIEAAEIADAHRTVSTEAAYAMIRKVAATEGLLISPSAGANLAAARSVAVELERGTIVTTLADDASKYGDVMAQLF